MVKSRYSSVVKARHVAWVVGSRVESSLDEWNKVRVALPSVDNSQLAGIAKGREMNTQQRKRRSEAQDEEKSL